MKKFINKIGLLLLCSAALFTQIKAAENYGKIIDDLNTIKGYVEIIHKNAGAGERKPYLRRTAGQKMNATLAQLPKTIQKALNPLVGNFKIEAETTGSTDKYLNFDKKITEQIAQQQEALKQQQQDEQAKETTWGGYFASKASKLASNAYYGARRGLRATQAAAQFVAKPVTWSIGKLLNVTDQDELDAAASKLEKINDQIQKKKQKVEKEWEKYNNSNKTEIDETQWHIAINPIKEALNKLNADKIEQQIILGEISSNLRKALYTVSASAAGLIFAYLADKATNGQLRAALTSRLVKEKPTRLAAEEKAEITVLETKIAEEEAERYEANQKVTQERINAGIAQSKKRQEETQARINAAIAQSKKRPEEQAERYAKEHEKKYAEWKAEAEQAKEEEEEEEANLKANQARIDAKIAQLKKKQEAERRPVEYLGRRSGDYLGKPSGDYIGAGYHEPHTINMPNITEVGRNIWKKFNK